MKTTPNNRMIPVLILICSVLLCPGQVLAADKPNIIIILCDDLGYGDIGCYGATDIRTPQLNRMAAEGTRFTDFAVTAPLCTPSRASFMTGRYPGRVGLATGVLRPNATNGLATVQLTLGEVVKPAGYSTAYIGKWHLGFLPGMRPMDQGFDSYFGVLHNLDHHETVHFKEEGGVPVLRGDTVVERPALPAKMTGLYTAEALRLIEQHRQHPFLIFLAHAMPHLPFDASPAFKGKSKRGLYGDVIEELDWSTGQILDKVRELGLAEKTLVLFTSDNGPERNTPGTAAPLSGTKHTVYEGGLRVPFIAWGPGRVPAGRVRGEFITALDLLPTIAQLSGGGRPPQGALDGDDISALMLGKTDAHVPENRSLFALYDLKQRRLESIRSGPWKLHLASPPQLFHLATDLGEATNTAAQNPKIVRRLTRLAEKIQRDTDVLKPAK